MRRALVLAFAVWLAAAAAGLGVRGTDAVQTTGDEPHYLLTAHSLAEDGDVDVRDDVEAGAYRPWHEAGLVLQGRPLADGRIVEPHDVGLSLLLAAPLVAGGWVAAKLTLALCAGALGALVLWLAVRRFGVPLRPALVTVCLFGASAPLAAYGTLVYPELPAALVVAAGLVTPLGAAVVLPWLGVKYALVAAVFAGFTLAGRRRAAKLAVLAAAAVAYVVVSQRLYGGLTPYAAGEHFTGGELTAVGADPDYLGRTRRLVGLLVDRTFGIAAWQPAWLLVVPAAAALAARRQLRLVLPLAAGWATATWLAATMHGWWFPGRQLVAVLPLAVIAVAWWAARSPRLAVGLGALGAAAWVAFLVQAYVRPLTWAVDFHLGAPPWRRLLPDHMDPGAADWALTAAWTLVLAYSAKTATRRDWGRSETRAPSGTASVDGRWETSVVPSRTTR